MHENWSNRYKKYMSYLQGTFYVGIFYLKYLIIYFAFSQLCAY